MDPIKIIDRYYTPFPRARDLLLRHSEMVARKALMMARSLGGPAPDTTFIEEAALLHDIGIFLTNAPLLGCHGHRPYICHGYLGREILQAEGLPLHALVSERHVGVGLTEGEIGAKGLPLPRRDMVPQSLEERLICFADKFYSKGESCEEEKTLDEVRRMIRGYGEDKLDVFEGWLKLFGGNEIPQEGN